MCSQHAGNAILETQILKSFFAWATIPPSPTRVSSKLVLLATQIFQNSQNQKS